MKFVMLLFFLISCASVYGDEPPVCDGMFYIQAEPKNPEKCEEMYQDGRTGLCCKEGRVTGTNYRGRMTYINPPDDFYRYSVRAQQDPCERQYFCVQTGLYSRICGFSNGCNLD